MIRIIISDGYQNFQLFMLNKFNFSNNPIDAVAILFLTTTILLSPFYIFSSGVAQPSHYIMALCALALMALKRNDFTNLLKKQKISIIFLLLICTINLVHGLNSHAINFFINSAYWIYNFTILFGVILIASEAKYYKIIRNLIFTSFSLIIILYFLGLGEFKYPPRYNGFFNSPNQIGYYTTLMLIVFFLTNNKKFNTLFFFIYAFALFIIYLSGSRSVYLAILSLIFLFLLMPNTNFKDIGLLLLIPFVVFFLTKIPTLENKNYFLKDGDGLDVKNTVIASDTLKRTKRLFNKGWKDDELYSIKYQLDARGYDRLYKYPHFLIYGAGQGNDNRFITELMSDRTDGHNYEIHSSLFAVLFYYGFIGLILFLKTIYNFFLFKKNIIFLLPMFIYGLFTYGLRTPYFWFALGFIVLMSDIFKSTNKTK